MSENGIHCGLDDLAARIPDGCRLAVPPDYAGPAIAATHALIRRGARRLSLLAVPTSGLQADLLIGAGCVAAVEAAAITLGEAGPAPRFVAAIKAGTIAMADSTCPAIHAALQAAEKGLPFMPLRGILGSDVARQRPDWCQIDNPFGQDDPILLLPAIRPDVALFHAPLADKAGNVWVGRRRELVTMAHAARETLATVEAIHDGDLMADARLAPGTIPALYISAVAHAPRGAWPVGLDDGEPRDDENLALYARLARSEEGFADYLAAHGGRARAAA